MVFNHFFCYNIAHGDFMTEKDYKIILKDKLIEYRDTLNLPKNVTFGVEIEYENIVKDTVSYLLLEEQQKNPSLMNWKNTSEIDISEFNELGEELNGEIVSKILLDKSSTWQSLKTVLNMLEKNGAIITNKCGGHVNIGAHILEQNKDYWRNFFLLWLLYEDVIYKFSSGEFMEVRADELGLLKKISNYFHLTKLKNIKRIDYLGINRFDKCLDVYIDKNLSNEILMGNRIEFRIPNGTLSEEIWQNYINFFTRFVIACKKELDVEKTIYKIKKKDSSAVELADYVFDDEIDKEYFLIQTLKTNKIYKKELPEHKIYY